MPLFLLPPFVRLEVTKPTWSLSTLCHKFPNMLIGIGGDMNLPYIERESEQLTTNQYTYSISYSFLDTIANTGLQQIVNFTTRNNNTLDVVLTSHPSMAKQCVGMPGLSDHDIVFVETSSRAFRDKPARRKILIRKHANFDEIRATQKTYREAYNNYLIKTLTSDPIGSKRLGAVIKSKPHDHLGVAPLKEGNIIYCDPIQKAGILNRQFISVSTDDTKTSMPDLGPSQYPSMEDITESCEGVVKLLMNLKPHKAAGPKDIPLILLKEAADEIAPVITLLFHASLNQGNTLSTWRKALVVPISKKGSKSDASNYRPISLTSVLGKLCEHILHSIILTHLANHKILSDAQHGFSK